jgi:EAL domain-containing protein (putative c-di-GMP-specific phosphodiesterase class I)
MHLLVLDDEATIGIFIARVAKGAGWTVESVQDETAFQDALIGRRPDLIVLDMRLGHTDGVEQLRFLHGVGYTGPIALLSGTEPRILDSARLLGEALDLSILGAWQKPVAVSVLRDVLTEAESIVVGARRPSPAAAKEPLSSADIGSAIAAGEMRLFLQPVVDARSGAVTSFEALIRWFSPVRGMVPPDAFIPQAERDETLIETLTWWVIDTAIDHHLHLAAVGFPQSIAVNVSSANLFRLDFPDRLVALLHAKGAPPSALRVEVTETLAMLDPRATIDVLTRLRLKDFEIAIDDFGAGYSSMLALARMPFSMLKVDKQIVAGLLTSREHRIITRAIIDLAAALGMTSVAEGVETREAADLLRDMGATSQQGYLYSPPLALADLIAWLSITPSEAS